MWSPVRGISVRASRSAAGRCLLRAAFVCLPILIGSLAVAQGLQSKTDVQVTFRVATQRYTDHFSADEVRRIEQAVQQALVDALNRQVTFLSFTRDDQPSRLAVVLKYSDFAGTGAGARRDTIFRIEVSILGQVVTSNEDWLYKGWTQFYDVLSTPEIAATEIGLAFAKLPIDHLVGKGLSHIPLSPTAHLVWRKATQDNVGRVAAVVIPIPASQLCMDDGSRLALSSQFSGDFGQQPVETVVVPQGEFRPADPSLLPQDVGHLFGIPSRASPDDQPWAVLDSAAEDKVSVKGIFVREYKPIDTGCSPVIQPSNSGLTGGGQ
ncbi:MAG TPA: hypothetical protein VN901_29635 [Candidatus Acidoferrales bacterium]|nr:hypothetical protein [Candidatus Acidoferrales bacterium]